MKLRYRGRTDVGKTREHNEDDYGFGEGAQVERYGELLVVCDGMGGHAAGEVASHLGVETIIAAYYSDPSEDRMEALKRAFEQANARIHAEGRGSMGTTGVAALLHHDALLIANVGDSRAYLIRNGTIRQISRDHSLVSEQVAAGVITEDQARSLYYRNVITRALGYQPEVVVDTFRWPLQPGDIVVLSSDGLHGLLSDEEICRIASSEPLEEAVDRLVDLANERGGSDNITVVIAHVDALDWLTAEDSAADTRDTEELPVQRGEALAQPALAGQAVAAEGAAAVAEASRESAAGPVAAPPAPRRAPAERRLSLAGILLSTLLLVALGATIYFLRPTPALSPDGPALEPPLVTQTTVAPSPDATGQPTATATSGTATATARTPEPSPTGEPQTPTPAARTATPSS